MRRASQTKGKSGRKDRGRKKPGADSHAVFNPSSPGFGKAQGKKIREGQGKKLEISTDTGLESP